MYSITWEFEDKRNTAYFPNKRALDCFLDILPERARLVSVIIKGWRTV